MLEHDIDDSDYGNKAGKVFIHEYAIIGGWSTILQGVTVGEGAVVAGSPVATKDVSSYPLVGGMPVHYIRDRKRKIRYKRSSRRYFH